MSNYKLTQEQIEALATHYENILNDLLLQVTDDFLLIPEKDANWYMLTHHLVELLQVADPECFRPIFQMMVNALKQRLPPENPFLGATMAQVGDTKGEDFEIILHELLKAQSEKTGLIHFGAGFLPLGDEFTTLWALRMLSFACKLDERSREVEAAYSAVKAAKSDLFRKPPDIVGFLLYVTILLYQQDQSTDKMNLVDECTKELIQNADTTWMKHTQDLRTGGFVAYDLLKLVEIGRQPLPIVEDWLYKVFDLHKPNPTSLPEAFAACRAGSVVDVWMQGWLRALVAAGYYLKLREPNSTPAGKLLSSYFVLYHMVNKESQQCHSQLETIINDRLPRFHDRAAQHLSVFVMQSTENNPNQEKTRQAILEELNGCGLTGRFVGDVKRPYLPDQVANLSLYLRGCKYGIMVFDRFPIVLGLSTIFPPENDKPEDVPVALALFDQDSSQTGIPDELRARCLNFQSSDPTLRQLRGHVSAWAKQVIDQLEE
jgi:hypothetical protein